MSSSHPSGTQERPASQARSGGRFDFEASLRLTQRTRRAVRDEVISTQERRARQRYNSGLALLGFGCLLVLLAPALWNGFEDLLAGEHVFDMSALVAILSFMLCSAMLAALFAVWKGQRGIEHDRGGVETLHSLDK